ncbi:NAD-binding protein [Fomitiporia mediterranea MF3/22]|uniref:NAD-binding protein n=1 Tax=Fomitiporia mediterranea (strain MF3/22) TaxID=694068 RepID=UPI000440800F|nr:NAD-binding protein [Fomitiporia mediterranea MF3/22]EJD07758.1 NAD-binding protein [Fomitiporia mediterranea MF3/22]
MPAVPAPAKVLVSGANGYIAVWVVRTLLDHGYSVRGTVRSESKNNHLRKVFKNEVDSGKLELVVVPDITLPGAFDEAVKGVDAIEHTASPFHFNADDPDELIGPAVKGTIGMLESALKFGGSQLKRVAVTSSCASILNPSSTGVLNEESWNEESIAIVKEKGREAPAQEKYRASKSLAEKAAWDFVEKNKSSITWDLVTLCPPFVFGPNLNEVNSSSELGQSQSLFYEALLTKRKTPEQLAGVSGGWVDVRDVALGHVRALEVPEAGGQRFILSSEMFIWQNWFDAANSLGLPDVPQGTPGAGKDFKYKFVYDSSRAKNVLGIQFRDIKTTTKDTVEDFKKRGW